MITRKLGTAARLTRTLGATTALLFTWYGVLRLRRPKGPNGVIRLHPTGLRHPLWMRTMGSSDVDVFAQIFVQREYEPIGDLASPHTVLDLGANVGYSSIWFLNRYPTATVIAVEPEPGNHALCVRNLAAYSTRARVVQAAVWNRITRLRLQAGSDQRDWATRVVESETGEHGDTVPALDVPALLRLAGGAAIDLLKVDIERSEATVFDQTARSWLPSIRNIAIELHDETCRRVFFESLAEFDFDESSSGELTICRDLRPKSRPTLA